MYVMTYDSLWLCAQFANQVENSLAVAMFVVAMVASNMNGLLVEKDFDLEILVRVEPPPPQTPFGFVEWTTTVSSALLNIHCMEISQHIYHKVV